MSGPINDDYNPVLNSVPPDGEEAQASTSDASAQPQNASEADKPVIVIAPPTESDFVEVDGMEILNTLLSGGSVVMDPPGQSKTAQPQKSSASGNQQNPPAQTMSSMGVMRMPASPQASSSSAPARFEPLTKQELIHLNQRLQIERRDNFVWETLRFDEVFAPDDATDTADTGVYSCHEDTGGDSFYDSVFPKDPCWHVELSEAPSVDPEDYVDWVPVRNPQDTELSRGDTGGEYGYQDYLLLIFPKAPSEFDNSNSTVWDRYEVLRVNVTDENLKRYASYPIDIPLKDLQQLTSRFQNTGYNPQIFRYGEEGPYVFRDSKITDECSSFAQGEFYKISEELARAIVYFTEREVDPSFCRLPDEGEIRTDVSPTDPETAFYQEDLDAVLNLFPDVTFFADTADENLTHRLRTPIPFFQILSALEAIEEAKAGLSEDANLIHLAAQIGDHEIDQLRTDIENQVAQSQTAVQNFLAQPWYVKVAYTLGGSVFSLAVMQVALTHGGYSFSFGGRLFDNRAETLLNTMERVENDPRYLRAYARMVRTKEFWQNPWDFTKQFLKAAIQNSNNDDSDDDDPQPPPSPGVGSAHQISGVTARLQASPPKALPAPTENEGDSGKTQQGEESRVLDGSQWPWLTPVPYQPQLNDHVMRSALIRLVPDESVTYENKTLEPTQEEVPASLNHSAAPTEISSDNLLYTDESLPIFASDTSDLSSLEEEVMWNPYGLSTIVGDYPRGVSTALLPRINLSPFGFATMAVTPDGVMAAVPEAPALARSTSNAPSQAVRALYPEGHFGPSTPPSQSTFWNRFAGYAKRAPSHQALKGGVVLAAAGVSLAPTYAYEILPEESKPYVYGGLGLVGVYGLISNPVTVSAFPGASAGAEMGFGLGEIITDGLDNQVGVNLSAQDKKAIHGTSAALGAGTVGVSSVALLASGAGFIPVTTAGGTLMNIENQMSADLEAARWVGEQGRTLREFEEQTEPFQPRDPNQEEQSYFPPEPKIVDAEDEPKVDERLLLTEITDHMYAHLERAPQGDPFTLEKIQKSDIQKVMAVLKAQDPEFLKKAAPYLLSCLDLIYMRQYRELPMMERSWGEWALNAADSSYNFVGSYLDWKDVDMGSESERREYNREETLNEFNALVNFLKSFVDDNQNDLEQLVPYDSSLQS